ncbi:MAG: hypothetical protein DCC68_01640 [Planctomycetota bacterium]|nr:MAG: hypothetical protein DCC68_01640 [Planctomycetota bacterium]
MVAAERSAAACDRAVVSTRAVDCVVGHVSVPLATTTVSPLVVAPLAVVPLEAPVVLQDYGRSAVAVRTVRGVAVRPLVVRPSRARSVTRVRTVVR